MFPLDFGRKTRSLSVYIVVKQLQLKDVLVSNSPILDSIVKVYIFVFRYSNYS